MLNKAVKIVYYSMAIFGLYILTNSTGAVGSTGGNTISDKDPKCENCGCCAPGACVLEGDGYICHDVCLTGFHGGRCLNRCPDNCIICKDHPNASLGDPSLWGIGYCTVCKEGYYSTKSMYQCQSACLHGCSLCTSGYTCNRCKTGYFMTTSGLCQSCRPGCTFCSSYTTCDTCGPGYIITDAVYCSPCPRHCVSCKLAEKCEVCETGYYEPPRGLGFEICEPCPSGCLICSPYQTYDECKPKH